MYSKYKYNQICSLTDIGQGHTKVNYNQSFLKNTILRIKYVGLNTFYLNSMPVRVFYSSKQTGIGPGATIDHSCALHLHIYI